MYFMPELKVSVEGGKVVISQGGDVIALDFEQIPILVTWLNELYQDKDNQD